jgi:hypothetical protein
MDTASANTRFSVFDGKNIEFTRTCECLYLKCIIANSECLIDRITVAVDLRTFLPHAYLSISQGLCIMERMNSLYIFTQLTELKTQKPLLSLFMSNLSFF